MASGDIRGKTVAIIGGGPGGCATAIRLAQLSRKRNLNLRVVLFEGKDFERHFNQCAGVLSPPIEELLQCRLDVELPYEIFKRQIFGCFWFEKVAPKSLIEAIGEDNLLFETDFPHPTCLYPNVQEYIAELSALRS